MEPSLTDGIAYWEKQEANINGVLGGHGHGPLPRVDSLGSRQFLLSILPKLCIVPSALRPLNAPEPPRTRALDVGAGVGRVTSDVLLHLCTDVVTLEPVESLIQKAISDASAWKGIGLPQSTISTKSVTFVRKPLQHFDPSTPLQPSDILAHMGISTEGLPGGYDIIWCQWCLGHLNNEELLLFLQQSRRSLREGGVIVVKENCCPDSSVGGPFIAFDDEDSSLMRSDKAWLHLFASAGLTVLKGEVQLGFPAGLFMLRLDLGRKYSTMQAAREFVCALYANFIAPVSLVTDNIEVPNIASTSLSSALSVITMTGVRLPAELWLQIGGHLPRADLNPLARTSHAFHSLLLPLLYRDIILSGRFEGATDYAERLQAIRASLERISAKSELVFAVRSCKLHRLEGALLEEVITFLGTLPNLSGLFLDDLTLEADQLIRLSKSWRSPVEFVSSFVKVKPIDLPPSVIKETPPKLSSLTITSTTLSQTSWRLFIQWSFSADLETLHLRNNPETLFNALFQEHIGVLPKSSFPRLKSLYLPILPIQTHQERFFGCMPMLENLYLIPEIYFPRSLKLSEAPIPRLRRYEGPAINIPSLVPQRPIHHLSLYGEVPTIWGLHTSPVLNFGSTSAIRYLFCLSGIVDPLPSLRLISLLCPSLNELQLNSSSTSHLSAFEFVQKHIQHLYKLSELRRLVYNVFAHAPTPNSLGWQRQICERLSEAAPNLTSVSLTSVITWNKSEVSREWKAGGMGLPALETSFPIGLAEWPALPPPPDRNT